jgi:hypothetical protein
MINQVLLNELKSMSKETRKAYLKSMMDHDYIELCKVLGFKKSSKKSINEYFEMMANI